MPLKAFCHLFLKIALISRTQQFIIMLIKIKLLFQNKIKNNFILKFIFQLFSISMYFIEFQILRLSPTNSFDEIFSKKRNLFKAILKIKSTNSYHYFEGFRNIDVVIPAIERDLPILSLVIASIRKFSLNPIDNIYIISPSSELIKLFCENNSCLYKDEAELNLPIKQSIKYIANGNDRSGWLFQQLIKLSANNISDKEYILVSDADTILLKPQLFVSKSKMMINCSDEYHWPYHEPIKKLLKIDKLFCLSFVSHYMILNAKILTQLKSDIENYNNCSWAEAVINSVDMNEPSGFSEYETYGNYIYFKHRHKIDLLYWNNVSVKRENVNLLDNLIKLYSYYFKSVSFHWYT
jgi:hypothetical protein